ncbi:hypothetical protein QAD02_004960 [Eretmocerus hayati]|uniref:Uncharacterized protein n=1 Tax=Eretmocerus hayati TaxID=131215 RepID=A0ACC2NS74_9HYME|nr:hypothetical protein QAD02_004960 [Eretmocerus hayati]
MTPCGIKIPTILLICFSLPSFEGSAVTDRKRRISLNGDPDYASPLLTREDGSLVFTTCQKINEGRVIECVIHVVKLSGPVIEYPFKHIKQSEYSLTRHVETSADMKKNVVYVKVLEIDPYFRNYVTVTAIDLTSGTVFQLDLPPGLPYKDEDISLIIDHNGANVIFRDPSVCGDHMPRCKFTFNKRGERLAGPVSFPIESGYLRSFPRVAKSADKGVLVYQNVEPMRYDPITRSIHIDASGKTTFLHSFPHFPLTFSDTGDLYLACSYYNSVFDEVDCAQYDWKLNMTIAFKLSLRDFSDEEHEIASVASLDKSKILVVHCELERGYDFKCKNARVPSINSDGQVLETTKLFDHLDNPELMIIEKAAIVEVDNEFCFHITYHEISYYYPGHYNPEYITVFTKCIPKSDL